MASTAPTLIPIDAIRYASKFVKNLNFAEGKQQRDILQLALSELWMADNWAWTTGTSTPVTLSSNTTNVAFSTTVANVLFPLVGYLIVADTTSSRSYVKRIPPVATLVGASATTPATFSGGDIAEFQLVQGASTSNIYFRPSIGVIPSTQTWTFQYDYKIDVPTLTEKTIYTRGVLQVPDSWWFVYQELVLKHAMAWADDQRLGGVSVTENSQGQRTYQYTGQTGKCVFLLDDMRNKEKINYDLIRAQDKREQ